MNTQPIEKPAQGSPSSLDVVEVWDTIQGEGPFAGTPAVFVRLAGCNLQCPGCDTNYTAGRRRLGLSQIHVAIGQAAKHHPRRLVVLTGGEPFRQDIGPLAESLLASGFRVQVETNGTVHLPGFPYDRVSVVCSPKTTGLARKVIPIVSAWKYVLEAGMVDPDDGLPLSSLGMPTPPFRPRNVQRIHGKVYVQPMDAADPDQNAANLAAAVESCRRFGYRLCLQLHKIVGLP